MITAHLATTVLILTADPLFPRVRRRAGEGDMFIRSDDRLDHRGGGCTPYTSAAICHCFTGQIERGERYLQHARRRSWEAELS